MAQHMVDGPKRGNPVLDFMRESAIVVVGALIASTLLRMFLVQAFVIPSGSMENTLLIGDRVAVQKVVKYERGDIVVFRDDYGWLPTPDDRSLAWWQSALMFVGLMPDDSQNYLIKRLIGLPGDHVKCCDSVGRMTVNSQPLDETAYLYRDSSGHQVSPSEVKFDVVVPQDKVFVMGDHRNNSQDSRCHLAQSYNGVLGGMAFVRTSSIVGTAVATVFPFARIAGHSRPSTFGSVPAPTDAAPSSPVITGDPPRC